MLLCQQLDQGDGLLVFGIGETLEGRRGPNIKSLGICRDVVRSSRSHLVRASGVRPRSWVGTHRANTLPLGVETQRSGWIEPLAVLRQS